ncbi:MFS transporter [Actinoallomurus sp. CA-142502]|uniref:MFS transporter n=1 Tax=Actinoallomurus sp. CA-142502 TaxID=3239885 RepID=UPI003D920F20
MRAGPRPRTDDADSRRGFASAVFAPLTAALLDHLTSRGTYLALAAILAVVTVPLHVLFLNPPWPARRREPEPSRPSPNRHARAVIRSGPFINLTVAMTLAAFGLYAATVNLVLLLTSDGTGNHLAAVALGLCGAGQVLGRLGYPRFAARASARTRAATVLIAGAVTVVLLGILPGPSAVLIAVAIHRQLPGLLHPAGSHHLDGGDHGKHRQPATHSRHSAGTYDDGL